MKKGDIVRRGNGWTPMEVVQVTKAGVVTARYTGTRTTDYPPVTCDDFVLITSFAEIDHCPDWRERLTTYQRGTLLRQIENHQTPKKEKTMSKDLYQTNEITPRFGTKLTVNSAGKVVLEMKGSGGAVELFDPSQIELVLPYTVSIRFLSDAGKPYDFFAKAGSVAVGDVLMLVGYQSLAEVMAVDTKSRSATATLQGRKVATSIID